MSREIKNGTIENIINLIKKLQHVNDTKVDLYHYNINGEHYGINEACIRFTSCIKIIKNILLVLLEKKGYVSSSSIIPLFGENDKDERIIDFLKVIEINDTTYSMKFKPSEFTYDSDYYGEFVCDSNYWGDLWNAPTSIVRDRINLKEVEEYCKNKKYNLDYSKQSLQSSSKTNRSDISFKDISEIMKDIDDIKKELSSISMEGISLKEIIEIFENLMWDDSEKYTCVLCISNQNHVKHISNLIDKNILSIRNNGEQNDSYIRMDRRTYSEHLVSICLYDNEIYTGRLYIDKSIYYELTNDFDDDTIKEKNSYIFKNVRKEKMYENVQKIMLSEKNMLSDFLNYVHLNVNSTFKYLIKMRDEFYLTSETNLSEIGEFINGTPKALKNNSINVKEIIWNPRVNFELNLFEEISQTDHWVMDINK